jgi:hypothetical protein
MVVTSNFFKIALFSKVYGERTVLIDKDDYALVSSSNWSITRNRYKLYARQTIWPRDQMHRVILGFTRGDRTIVDHINGDSLDNRRSNLRLVSPRGNALNSERSRDATMIHQRFNRFRIDTSINGKRFIASFRTREEAEEALRRLRDEI